MEQGRGPSASADAPPGLDPATAEAFDAVDRICRRSRLPSGASLLLRAYCLLGLGETEAARRDARAALDRDGADPAILHLVLTLHPQDRDAAAIAATLLALPHATEGQLAAAAEQLLRDTDLVLRCASDALGVSGTLAWRGREPPRVRVDGTDVALVARPLGRASGMRLARLRAAWSPHPACLVEAGSGPRATETLRFPATRPERPDASAPVRDRLGVIVPVYGGLAATRACLEALAAQTCGVGLDVIVVDGASPDAALSRWVEDRCRAEGWRYARLADNAGFAGAVNVGASQARGQDLLLLNADALLPPGAIERLLEAAREPGVGTVVPFSNDGGFTSFPRLRLSHPVPTAEDAARIDRAARTAAPCPAVDIPSGTAFCMLVTRRCWDAVGGLSRHYGRGYFEDVNLCLRAKRLGYRNVLAPRLYVRHIGSQSFGSARRALVAGNARLVRERFPDYDPAWAAFVAADPLQPLRSAMERLLPPAGPVRLLVGRVSHLGFWLAPRAARIADGGDRVVGLEWRRDGGIAVRAADGDVPQSLTFGPGERDRLAAYLGALDLRGIEIAEPDAVLGHVLSALLDTGAPLTLSVLGRAAARFLERTPPPWAKRAEIVPGDRMVAAALERDRIRRDACGTSGPMDPRTSVSRSGCTPVDRLAGIGEAGAVRIAALAPVATAAADRLLVGLDRRLRAAGGEVVVFGPAWGAGRRFPKATGDMPPQDYPDALRQRRITHLLLPDPDLPFGLLDDLRLYAARPAAYIDWSGRGVAPAAGDLALAEDLSDDEAAARILAWCQGGGTRPARDAAPAGGAAR